MYWLNSRSWNLRTNFKYYNSVIFFILKFQALCRSFQFDVPKTENGQYLSSFISKNQICLIPALKLCVMACFYVIKKIAVQTSKLKDSQGGRAPLGQNK